MTTPNPDPIEEQQNITAEEQQGVKMIVALQAFAGIEEPKDRALTNWRNFTIAEKEQTRFMYKLLFE